MCFVPFFLAKSVNHFSLQSHLLPVSTTWACCNWQMPQLEEDSKDFIFQQDRAPPHFHFDVHAHLSANLPSHWIGHASNSHSSSSLASAVNWPNPLWFFLMGLYQWSCVCAPCAMWFTTAATKDRGAVAAIDCEMLKRVWQEFDYRIDVYRVTKCGHMKHL
jgi:hypothetical protein